MFGTSSRRAALLLALALTAGACSSGEKGGDPSAGSSPRSDAESFDGDFSGASAYPIFVNSEITVGENRMLIGVLDDSDAPIGSPEITLHVSYFDLEASTDEPVEVDEPEFMWSVEGSTGVYVGEATFDRAGRWGAEIHIVGDGLDETLRTSFEVTKESRTPEVGERVPASDTPTMRDVASLEKISTDADPERSFYRRSIAEAVRGDLPFVVVFATPKFCQTAVCGPTLDIVKSVAKDTRGATFIHVEPYELPAEPPNFEVVDAVEEWGLPSEPWVFVVGRDGRLVAKFEGVVGEDELRETLASL
jgi:hypothetical protein